MIIIDIKKMLRFPKKKNCKKKEYESENEKRGIKNKTKISGWAIKKCSTLP